MTTFNSHKWIKLYKESRLTEADETEEFADDLTQLAKKLGPELEDQLQDMDSQEQDVNEIVGTVVSVIGYILLSNTVVAMLSGFAKKAANKFEFTKTANAAKKVHDFAHGNEQAFMMPIKRIVGIFIKDKKLLDKVTYVLYALVIFLMAGAAGGNALASIKKSAYFESAFYTLKTAIKGKEVSSIIKQVIS